MEPLQPSTAPATPTNPGVALFWDLGSTTSSPDPPTAPLVATEDQVPVPGIPKLPLPAVATLAVEMLTTVHSGTGNSSSCNADCGYAGSSGRGKYI
ncbi:UNVERIFIED_CONTAM: hypothetical protein FKN15_076626 [Acipenser sinensis]